MPQEVRDPASLYTTCIHLVPGSRHPRGYGDGSHCSHVGGQCLSVDLNARESYIGGLVIERFLDPA